MDTIFINSKNSKTPAPHRLLLNLTDKIDLRRKDKCIALSNLSIYYTWKNIKKSYKSNKFKISAPTWNEEFELPDDHIRYQVFEIILNTYLKKTWKKTVNPSIRIYTNKIENKKVESWLKINTGYIYIIYICIYIYIYICIHI